MFARAFLLVSLVASQTAFANDIETVINKGKKENQAYQRLSYFTKKFGPRLTGSPQLKTAQDWAVAEFKKFGIANARLEKWGEVPVGFYRGNRQVAKMTSPWKTTFEFTTPAWTPGTNGKIKVNPVMEPTTEEEYEAIKKNPKDVWILMSRPSGIRGPAGELSAFQKKVDELPVAGKIWGTADERVHTGGRFFGLEWDKLPTQVQLRVRKSDYSTIALALKAGRKCELELDIENYFVKGPVPQYNVIADIPGTEKPDEQVIVCGHFDSWNGPGSHGANDNGTGSSVTLESARLIMASGVKPKRTIRFILWSGEEQGLLGSRAYVEMHKAEMSKISAVFNDDGGTNYQGGYICHPDMAPMLQAAIDPVNKAFPNLPAALTVQPKLAAGGSSDHASFVAVGVPAFFTIESGKADYGYVWHTQHDRAENSVPEYQQQSSTNAAAVALSVANANTMLPRPADAFTQRAGAPRGATRNYYKPGQVFEDDHGDHHDHDHGDEWLDYQFDRFMRMIGAWKS